METEATATETHYTYFPTTAVADTSTSAGAGTTATAVVTTQNSEALLGQPTPTGTALQGGVMSLSLGAPQAVVFPAPWHFGVLPA